MNEGLRFFIKPVAGCFPQPVFCLFSGIASRTGNGVCRRICLKTHRNTHCARQNFICFPVFQDNLRTATFTAIFNGGKIHLPIKHYITIEIMILDVSQFFAILAKDGLDLGQFSSKKQAFFQALTEVKAFWAVTASVHRHVRSVFF